ncbi:hypothetical protein DYB30_012986, partial [Aphanomyces astaci]
SSSSSTFKRARSEHNLDDMTSLSFPSSPTNSLRGLDECTLPAATVEVASLMLDDSAIAALSDVELGALSEQLIEDVVKQLVALAGTSPELLEEVSYIHVNMYILLADKCALSLGTKRRSSSLGDPFDEDNELEVSSSVMTDTDDGRLMAAMELMAPDELALLEEDARVIQHNVRAWLLRRSYRHMRDTTRKLKEAARGIICRKKFAQMKTEALASLVIQRNATGKKQPSTN